MCLQCSLLCPKCEEHIEGMDCLYPCLLKMGNASSICDNEQAWRYMTPTEMVLTTKSCTNVRCAMSVTQQLICQSRIWHVVDLMDAKQMEESQAQAITIPRHKRAMIRKLGRDTLSASAPIPPVADVLNWWSRPGVGAPCANTSENLLLHQALSYRRQRMEKIQLMRESAAADSMESFWDEKISDALSFGEIIYRPSDEEENTEHDNSKRAALEEEYAVLCENGDTLSLWTFTWTQDEDSQQPGSSPTSSSEIPETSESSESRFGHIAGPGLKCKPTVIARPRKRKASSQTPVASTSTSARIQLDNRHSSIHPIQRTFDDSVQDSNGLAGTTAYNTPGQQPLRGQSQPPKSYLGTGSPTREITVDSSPSSDSTVPNRGSFDHRPPSKHWHMTTRTGEIPATQTAFQNSVLTHSQPDYTAGDSFADVSGSQAQPVTNMGGPPPPQAQPVANLGETPPLDRPDADMD